MKRKTKTKALSWLLSLAMVLSLIPAMSMTAYADNTETLLTTITPVYPGFASYTVAGIAEAGQTGAVYIGSVTDENTGNSYYTWISGASQNGQLTVTGKEGYTITRVVFSGDITRNGNKWSKEYTDAPYAVYVCSNGKIYPTQADQDAASNSLGVNVTSQSRSCCGLIVKGRIMVPLIAVLSSAAVRSA